MGQPLPANETKSFSFTVSKPMAFLQDKSYCPHFRDDKIGSELNNLPKDLDLILPGFKSLHALDNFSVCIARAKWLIYKTKQISQIMREGLVCFVLFLQTMRNTMKFI